MKISKKWRLLIIPLILWVIYTGVTLWLNVPAPSGGSLPVIERVANETRYIVLPKSLKLGQSLDIQLHIESYEHPETHQEPLDARLLLTLNNEEPLVPSDLTVLSQDEYHLKSLINFQLPKNSIKIRTITLHLFDLEEHQFVWKL